MSHSGFELNNEPTVELKEDDDIEASASSIKVEMHRNSSSESKDLEEHVTVTNGGLQKN